MNSGWIVSARRAATDNNYLDVGGTLSRSMEFFIFHIFIKIIHFYHHKWRHYMRHQNDCILFSLLSLCGFVGAEMLLPNSSSRNEFLHFIFSTSNSPIRWHFKENLFIYLRLVYLWHILCSKWKRLLHQCGVCVCAFSASNFCEFSPKKREESQESNAMVNPRKQRNVCKCELHEWIMNACSRFERWGAGRM